MTTGRNRRAANRTIRELRKAGALSDQHGALVQLVTSIADAIDADAQPDATLWREYRLALAELAKLGTHDTDAYADLVNRLRTPLGNTAN